MTIEELQAKLAIETAALNEAVEHAQTEHEESERWRERSDTFETRLAKLKADPLGWKPEATAPRDGRIILVAFYGHGPYRAQYRTFHPNAKGKKCWRDPSTGHKLEAFTHWAELPPMPSRPKAVMAEAQPAAAEVEREETQKYSL